jgi:DNA polymerase-1
VLDLPADARGLVVAVDTETSGLHPDDRLPEGGRCRVAVVTLAWCDEDGTHTRAYPFDQGTRDKIAQAQQDLFALEDPNLGEEDWIRLLDWLSRQLLVFHNAKFDLMFLAAGTRHWPGRDLSGSFHFDTMVGAHTIEPTDPVSLDACERRWFSTTTKKDLDLQLQKDIKALKGSRRTGGAGNHDLVPWSSIEDYAANDARLTIEGYWYLQGCLDEGVGDPQEVAEDQALTMALYAIESRGIRYDAADSRDLAEILAARAARLAEKLPFPANPEGAKRYYFRELNYKPFHETDGGKPQFALEDQALAAEQGWPFAKEYAEIRKLETAVSMWYNGYAEATGEDGRLRTNYRQTRVKSGRMSVERVQLQAIPKDDKALDGIPTVRSLFVPADGYELWNLDLSQAELRLATYYAKCERMAEMLARGADLHGITTREIFDVHPGRDAGDGEHPYKTCHCDDCEEFGVKRDIAKRLTFGGIFQIGAKTFQATLAKLAGIYLPIGECEEIVKRWRTMYPEFGYAYRASERMVRDREWVPLIEDEKGRGRYRSYFNLHRPPVDFPNTGWNRRVQGSLAKFNQLWLVAAEEWTQGDCGATRVVLNVHDSLVLEIKSGSAEEKAQWVADQTARMATELFGTEMTIDVKEWS